MSHSPKGRKRFKQQNDFIVFTPAGDDISLAHKRSCEMGILPGSYAHGMGRLTGCLGEIAVNAYLPRSKYVGNTIFTHDIDYKKQRIEVKSKVCSGQPRGDFSAFVNCKKGAELKADVLFFTRVRRDLALVYLVGWLPVPTFFDEATFKKKGQTELSGFTYKTSGYDIEIGELNPPLQFKKSKGCL